jgi:hypothetical protein
MPRQAGIEASIEKYNGLSSPRRKLEKFKDALGIQLRAVMFLLQCQQLSSINSTHRLLEDNMADRTVPKQAMRNLLVNLRDDLTDKNYNTMTTMTKLAATVDSMQLTMRVIHGQSAQTLNQVGQLSQLAISKPEEIQRAVDCVSDNLHRQRTGPDSDQLSVAPIYHRSPAKG